MGVLEELIAETRQLHARFNEYFSARECELHEQALARQWVNPSELVKMFKLSRDSVNNLVREGKQAGIVRVAAFRVSKGGKVSERIEVTSFERWLEMGGVAAVEERGKH